MHNQYIIRLKFYLHFFMAPVLCIFIEQVTDLKQRRFTVQVRYIQV